MTAKTESRARRLAESVSRVIIGKEEVVLRVVAVLLAGGHALLEDVPGTGKTMLARALAKSLSADFHRVQFTPDLLPSDLTGVSVYQQDSSAFKFIPGPLFANVLLADELNRATPRTQSALLEAMEEQTVSVDGTTHALPRPFFVLATQNPIEHHGVYSLPESQVDRFMARLSVGYATQDEERQIVEAQRTKHPIESVEAVVTREELIAEQSQVRDAVEVEPNIADYIVRISGATRVHRDVLLGASARASIALYRMAQARAWLNGDRFVSPDLVKEMAPSVLCHRLLLRPQARLSGIKVEQIVDDILQNLPVPVLRMR